MKFWRRWSRGMKKEASEDTAINAKEQRSQGTIPLPQEPFVFECGDCGKIFEVRRRRAACPECDSENVSILSD